MKTKKNIKRFWIKPLFATTMVFVVLAFLAPISVYGAGSPVANFSYAPKADNPLQIDFTDTSAGDIAKWKWDFGDVSLPFIVSYQQKPEGTLVNTSVEIATAYPSVSGNIIVGVMPGGSLYYYDISSKKLVNTMALAFNMAPNISGDTIAFVTKELPIQMDLNGDGKLSNDIVMYYDVGENKVVSTRGETFYGTDPSISRDIIAFITYETSIDTDLDGNGSKNDAVLRYFDRRLGRVFNTKVIPSSSPLVYGNIIAFPTYEFGGDQNGDGDQGDIVLRYFDVTENKLISTAAEMMGLGFSIFDDKIAFISKEGMVGGTGTDLNGDGDKTDYVVRYFDISLGRIINTGAEVTPQTKLSMSEYLIAFITPETSVGRDLNGDGDISDDVLRYYDLSAKEIKNTKAEIFNNPYAVGNPSVSGKRIAFLTDESSVGRYGMDLNGDGDTGGGVPDFIVRYFDASDGRLYNTGAEAVTSGLFISGNVIAFKTSEKSIGANGLDLNENGNIQERMLRYFLIDDHSQFNGSTSHIYAKPGAYNVTLTITDKNGVESLATKNITAGQIVSPPLSSFTARPTSGDAPLAVQFTDTSTNSPTSWQWDFDNNGVIDSSLQNPSHTYTAPNTYTVSLTVSNQAGSNTKTIPNLISVTAPDTTLPTVSITQPLDNAMVQDTIVIKANASDNKGVNRVEFYIDNTLHSADNTSPYEYSWDTRSVSDGLHSIKAKAYDDAGNSGEDNIAVRVNNTPPPVNHPSVLAPIGNQAIDEGKELRFTVSATDPDGDALDYSAANLPLGASFNQLTRVFSWTPNFNQSGTYSNVHFEASDGRLIDFEDITITVNDVIIPPPPPVNHPPVANAGSDQTVESNSFVQLNGSASFDPDNDLLTYQWTQISGQRVSLGDSNQDIASFIAPELTSAQALEFQLTVTDPGNLSSNNTAIITVKPKPEVKPAIKITQPQDSSIIAPRSKVTITANVQDNGNLVKNVSFLVNNKTYRAGKNRQGAYSYNWTVPYGYSKTYTINAQAQDKQKNIVADDSIIVVSSSAPTISLIIPQDNRTVLPKASIPVTVNLSPNNIGITKVEFYINNQRKYADRRFPYSYNWRVPKELNQTYSIQARAFTRDEDGRKDVLVGESETVTVRVE